MAVSKSFNLGLIIGDNGKIVQTAISDEVPLGTEDYATPNDLPLSGNDTGDTAYVASTNRLYLWNGQGWYNISLVNESPIWDSAGLPEAAYVLDSVASTTINLIATDPEEQVLNWTYEMDSGDDFVTVTNDSNGTFIIAPKSLQNILDAGYDSSGGSFDITFKASDGVNTATASSNFTLGWAPNTFQLWRLYASVGPSYYLWDIDNAGGIYLGDGTRLSTSGTSGTAMSATYGQIPVPGKYGIYTSNASDPFTQTTYNGGWDAGPGNMFNGARTSWSSGTGHWIAWYLHDPIEYTAMEGGSLNLRTFIGARPNRCPQETLLQYYTGNLNGTYDAANWVTFATLRSNQTNGNPTWSNITEGSIITV